MTKIGFKESLTEASLGRKCFRMSHNDREFYKFKNNYVRDFICKSIEGARVWALIDISSRDDLMK